MIVDGGAPLDDNREHENLCFFLFLFKNILFQIILRCGFVIGVGKEVMRVVEWHHSSNGSKAIPIHDSFNSSLHFGLFCHIVRP